MWSDVITLFREYMGTGLIVIWFMVSLVYLWVNEKKKHMRILFLYTPIIVLLLFFNPLFAKLVCRVAGDEIYYRILWLLPVTVVNAYSCTDIYEKLARRCAGRRLNIFPGIYAVCMAGIFAVSGSYIYSNPYFHEAENLYHVPDSVVHICDAIVVPGREVMAVFPPELVQFVRQYSPVVCMPYGREALVKRWGFDEPIYDVMEEKVIDLEQLAPLVREAGCHYVILKVDKDILGVPEDYGWIWFGETDGYVIYRDPSTELIIPQL